MDRQGKMKLFTHGGSRKGAGCKKILKGMQTHIARPEISDKYPLHINVKIKKNLPNLRTKKLFTIVKKAIIRARVRGFRINHFAVLKNHIHLIAEGKDKEQMGKAMQALTLSLAKSINSTCRRTGKVFIDRYHLHILRTPIEVKNALKYVFKNAAKHYHLKNIFDPYSSLIAFKEKEKLLGQAGFLIPKILSSFDEIYDHLQSIMNIVDPPTSWLLKTGWSKSKS